MEARAAARGYSSAEKAVTTFMGGLRRRDFAAVATSWGSRDGLLRSRISESEFEVRATIMACYLGDKDYRFIGTRPDTAQGVLATVREAEGTRTEVLRLIQDASHVWVVEVLQMRSFSTKGCK